ncbi:MAG TPA: FISUMP domain-containing protein [Vicinamibacterales bacterium]
MTPIRIRFAVIALSIAFGSLGGAGSAQRSMKEQNVSSKRMADGKEWTTANLNVNASESYCYDDAESNCRRYGRLYTWASAQRVCESLVSGWRLPTDDEWRQLAKRYGGVSNDSASAPFYNFGKGGGALHRQLQGEKQMAISVRCVRP